MSNPEHQQFLDVFSNVLSVFNKPCFFRFFFDLILSFDTFDKIEIAYVVTRITTKYSHKLTPYFPSNYE